MEIPGKTPPFTLPAPSALKDDAPSAAITGPVVRRDESDTVALSTHAGEVRQAVRTLDGMPDVRADKVAEIRRRIASGTYRIAGDRLAADLIGETMQNNRVLNHIDHGRD